MAIDSQHTSTSDRDAAIEAHKDARARAFLIIGAASFAVALIIAAVVHFTSAKTPAAPIATRPSEASVEAQDKAAAITTIQRYQTANDMALRAGSIEGTGIEDFADYNIVQNVVKYVQSDKADGTTFRGRTVVSPTSITWKRTSSFNRLVTVKVCSDLSKVALRDSQGQPIQNLNPDGTPNNRKRIPSTFYVEAMKINGSQSAYKVVDIAPEPSQTATC